MTTKTKLIIGASAIALVGGFFIYKKLIKKPIKPFLKDDTKKDDTKKDDTKKDDIPKTSEESCKKYIVNVKSGNLNIRQEPNDKSKIIGSLPKSNEISAKKSSVEGWMQLCERIGFVSQKFLK